MNVLITALGFALLVEGVIKIMDSFSIGLGLAIFGIVFFVLGLFRVSKKDMSHGHISIITPTGCKNLDPNRFQRIIQWLKDN